MTEHDLARLFHRLRVDAPTLEHTAALLADFARQHASALTFEAFPLPDAQHGVLCAYELHRDTETGATLYLNALGRGAHSAVHDHGSWAVIAGVLGVEVNREYEVVEPDGSEPHARTDRAHLRLRREVSVGPGDVLVLPRGAFHSVHVPADTPALQLHLYGQALDAPGATRQAVDLASGRLVPLIPPGPLDTETP